MSGLEELIQKLCPDGVEYKTIEECFYNFNGMTGVSLKWKEQGNCKFIDYMNAYKNLKIDVTSTPYATVKNLNQNVLKQGDILLTTASEVPDECAIASVIEDPIEENVFMDDHLFGLRLRDEGIINTTFVAYYMHTRRFRSDVRKKVKGVTRFFVSPNDVGRITIPVPPLEVQSEIVRILDNFTELTAELTSELTARKQQFEYYRDCIFNFKCEFVKKKFGDITRVFSASRVHRNEWTTEGVPFLRSSDVVSHFNGVSNPRGNAYISKELYDKLSQQSGRFHSGDVLITGGGTIGIPYLVPSDDPIYVKDADLICIQKSDELDSRFIYYYFLTSKFRRYLSGITHDATIAHYTILQVSETEIPVPPMDVQKQVVNILDKLDAFCSDINIGLPAEIKARQKQYEYYRDKLLTFKEKLA